MGSEVVKAIVAQLGRITTNLFESPQTTSKPIEQFDASPLKTFQPLEQKSTLKTAVVNFVDVSKPIEQIDGLKFPKLGGGGVNDSIIEQLKLETEPGKSNASSYEGPIQQLIFGTRDIVDATSAFEAKPVQQFTTNTSSTTSKPVEQVPRIINTIDVTQFDFIDLIFPPCNSIKNPVNSNILWRINDLGFDFNVETLIFTVQGSPVQDQAEFSTTAIPGGLQLTYDRPEDYGFEEEVEIILEIEDTAVPPNFIFFRCKWVTVPDTRAPSIINLEPECDSTGVLVTAPVEFDVVDIGAGVDADSLRLTIEGISVCSGVTVDVIPSGIHVTYEHPNAPFRFESFVTVGIEVADLSPLQNSTLFVCCFATEESQVPEFLNFSPEACESFVDNVTGLSFEVYGVEDGVDISTLEVRVDNELRRVFVNPRILRSE